MPTARTNDYKKTLIFLYYFKGKPACISFYICSGPTTNYPIYEWDTSRSRWHALARVPEWYMLFVNGRYASQEYTLRHAI